MLRRFTLLTLAVVLLISYGLFSQTYQGPQQGSVDTGAVVNTGTLADFPITGDSDPIIRGEFNLAGITTEPLYIEDDGNAVFPVTYVGDKNVGDRPEAIGDNAMLLKKFNVNIDNNVIPPDPTIAVGPNHVMVLTNNGSGIRIYDKQGTLLKTISSTQWWSAVWPSQSGDPQILYDHFENRWVMVFMQVDDAALTAGNLIAYSDDSDPLGTWYMYRLDTKKHGTTNSNTWGDYPQIGFDDQAIYIMTRCFTFGSGFNYTKIRIISKAELYASNAGSLTYNDIWDITLPGSTTRPDVIHPSFQYSAADGHYLMFASRSGGSFYSLYKITDPGTNHPTLSGVNITVPFYGTTPNANQLGGGTPLIESNGSHMKTAPVFRDGYLYATHSIRNTVYPNYASVKYVKIDVATNTVVESAELGADKYFYIYPAIAVDKDGNIGITFSRSAESEYMGSYFTTRRATDPSGLSSSYTLQPGLGNYNITFGGTRNRWGDYLGAYLDPADEYSFWFISEYASGTNAYNCVVGQARLQPFDSIYIFPANQVYNFGEIEIGKSSDTLDIMFSNYGTSDLIISEIPDSIDDFKLLTNLTYPFTVSTFDTLIIKFLFAPSFIGAQSIAYPITTNFADFSSLDFTGKGYSIQKVDSNTIYAISGAQNIGNAIKVNKINGQGVNIGASGYNDLIGLAIHPKTKIMYSVRSSVLGSYIMRINAANGDAYPLIYSSLPDIFSIAFDTLGNLFAALKNGKIYKVNLEDETDSLISVMPCERVSIKFRPSDNQLWGTVKNFLGNPKDQIIKIYLETGDTTRIGRTGFAVNTIDLAFDENNQLFGIKGSGAAISDLIKINQSTGTGSLVGSVGLKDLTGLAYFIEYIPNSINDQNIIPESFSLSQNFPNPFNPSTQIRFALPVSANVRVTVYNLLGEVVKQLSSKDLNAGNHSVEWNADDDFGNKVSSGIYFYELNANGVDGSRFNQVRKMLLLK